jgi:hypothetical protein
VYWYVDQMPKALSICGANKVRATCNEKNWVSCLMVASGSGEHLMCQ